MDLEFTVPWCDRQFADTQRPRDLPATPSASTGTAERPAAWGHPEGAAAAAAAAGPGAANAVAAVSSLPAVTAEGLGAAAEAAGGAPDPVQSQGHFQVSALLKVVSRNVCEHTQDFNKMDGFQNTRFDNH